MSDTKMTVWALFDSGNGSYTKGVTALNSSGGANIDIYPVGIDIENKNNHFINLNLADYNRLFGDNTLFDELDKLPKPDLIIASPPCESWSNASAMSEGNACWKQEDLSDSLFAPQREASMFTIRNNSDYDKAFINYQYDRQFMKRVNGELTAFNTIEIIKRYEPLYWLDIKAIPKEPIEYHTSLGVKKEKRKLAELQIFFEYIEANKQNLFDLCGLRGELA